MASASGKGVVVRLGIATEMGGKCMVFCSTEQCPSEEAVYEGSAPFSVLRPLGFVLLEPDMAHLFEVDYAAVRGFMVIFNGSIQVDRSSIPGSNVSLVAGDCGELKVEFS